MNIKKNFSYLGFDSNADNQFVFSMFTGQQMAAYAILVSVS